MPQHLQLRSFYDGYVCPCIEPEQGRVREMCGRESSGACRTRRCGETLGERDHGRHYRNVIVLEFVKSFVNLDSSGGNLCGLNRSIQDKPT